MMVAGEASGDLHGAALYRCLKQNLISMQCIAMGGVEMRNAGVPIVVDSADLGVIGVWDVITRYMSIRLALTRVKKHLKSFSPDLLICIDYKEFNFQVAKYASSLGIKVLFYISPQVWAWRPNRVKKYGEIVDMMAVIFPFEVGLYTHYSIPVRYVGHPLVNVVKVNCSKEQGLTLAGLNQASPVIGLFPGSRVDEVKRLLPVLLEAAELLGSKYPGAQFILPKAPNINDQLIQGYLNGANVCVNQCQAGNYDLLQSCDVAISASGTTTLELALLGVPMVIVYKLAPLTYFFAKRLVRIPYIGLPNIVAGKGIVTELIQDQLTSKTLLSQVCKILDNTECSNRVRRDLSELHQILGDLNGIEMLAELAEEMLG